MRVILSSNIKSLGAAGEIVKVSEGYARNFLFPKGLALEATEQNLKALDEDRKISSDKIARRKKSAQAIADTLKGMTCVLVRRVGDQGRIFGSVNSKDIEQALADQGLEIDRRNILLSEPIKSLGDFTVKIKIDQGIFAEIKVSLVPE